jgi:hypothetical protein
VAFLVRLRATVAVIIGISAIALVYAEVGLPLLRLVEPGGKHEGFLSDTVANLETVVPIVLTGLLLGIVLWLVYGQVQDERTVRRR